MINCKFCNSETIEIPDFETATDYGDFHHVCKNCGAVGYEVLGHGISWSSNKIIDAYTKNEIDNKFKEK